MISKLKGIFRRKPPSTKPTDDELKASIASKLDTLILLPADEAMGVRVTDIEFDDLDEKEQLVFIGEAVKTVAFDDLPMRDKLHVIEVELKQDGNDNVECITASPKYESKTA